MLKDSESIMERIILHVDMDAFFASVEQRDNAYLRGKPVIVGGTSKRGVVATCSYEARKYGVHSAMPVYKAKQLCPNGIFVKGNHGKYKKASMKVLDILYEITDKIEQVSIDEAYLDISEHKIDYLNQAKYLKWAVKEKTGLTISVGLSYNKFLAKLASDWDKPDGLKIITKDMIPDILIPLKIGKVYGIGKKSIQRLNNIGILTIGDLYKLSKEHMVELFGKYGIEIYDRIRGIDYREVNGETSKNKSIGRETTLIEDTKDKEKIKPYLKKFSENISEGLIIKGYYAKTISIKYKTASFHSHTRSKTLKYPIRSKEDIYNEGIKILEEIDLNEKIRLIGLTVTNVVTKYNQQLNLFDIYNKQ